MMDGPGPSTQMNASARTLRARPRIADETVSGTQGSHRALLPKKVPQVDDDDAQQEEGDSDDEFEDEDDSEYDEDGNKKEPVYHWQIWRQLLRLGCMREKGRKNGLLRYVNCEPEQGDDPLDVTAPTSSQLHWDLEDRTFWPPILNLWNRPTPWTNPTYRIGVLRYKGHIVLDTAGNPIRNLQLPLTISSRVEGLRIEAWMRSDSRLALGDIEARLWTKETPHGGRKPFYDRRTLSKRSSLARVRAGLISWVPKKGRDAQNDFLDQLRTPEQRARNEPTDQDLTTELRAAYALISLDEDKNSDAPTREERIRKIKKTAAAASTIGSSSETANVGSAGHPVSLDSEDSEDDSGRDQVDLKAEIERRISDAESVGSSIIDPLDSRHDKPADPQEEDLLQRALAITVESFVFCSGQQPVLTNRDENYFSQWAILQAQHRRLWIRRHHRARTDGTDDSFDSDDSSNAPPVPRLRARGRWTGGISQFESSEEIEDDFGALEEGS